MKKAILVLVSILSLALASCGEKGPSTEINVALLDFQFTPNQFIVPAGQKITVNVVNTGAVVHNFIIMKLGITAGDTYDDADAVNVFWEEVDIQPGGDISASFIAPTEPGEYQIICRTEGHIASGMVGKLVVVAGE
jgi:plastocyanin